MSKREKRFIKAIRSYIDDRQIPYIIAISLMESSNYKMTFERAVKMSIALGVDVEQLEYVDERVPIIVEKSEVNIFIKDKVILELELNKMFGKKLAPIRCSRQSQKCKED